MTEGRIQDWIRYVHDRAEHVEESQENSPLSTDVSTQNDSAAKPNDESSSHNTSQPALQTAPSLSGSATTDVSPSEVSSSEVSASAPPVTSRGERVTPESRVTREGRVLPSLTAQAVRRSVARARSLAANPPSPEAEELEVAAEKEASPPVVAAVQATEISLPKTTRRGRRSKVENEEKVRQRVRQRPETRAEMLDRLENPTISLYEASVLLDVCSATVRRYTNSGLLPHVRTEGGQRRFRLRDVLVLLRQQESKKN